MYINHLEYHQRLLSSLCENVQEFPAAWGLSQRPIWTGSVAKTCRALNSGARRVHNEARMVRKMVSVSKPQTVFPYTDPPQILEQHQLSQSLNLSLLTVLASFFVPLSAVAVRTPSPCVQTAPEANCYSRHSLG